MTFVPNRRAQSSHGGRLPGAARAALLAVLLGATATPVAAQTGQVRNDDEPLLAEPAGVRIARLARNERFATGTVRASHTAVTLEGWIYRESVAPDTREGHDLRVTRTPEENLRAAPNGRIVARVVQGALMDEIERRGNWILVRRGGWVATRALGGFTAAAAPPPRPDSTRRTPAQRPDSARRAAASAAQAPAAAAARDTAGAIAQEGDPRRGVARRRIQLFRAPDSAAIGSLEAGLPVRVTARAGAWVRVEAQGWVRESEIRLSDAGIMSGVTAAELRGAPDQFRGRLIRWTIQYIALQTADDLRPDFVPGQRYILARGPAPEYAFVYLVVPDERLAEVQRLEPLAGVTVVARVIAGRSAYLANPILELVELQP